MENDLIFLTSRDKEFQSLGPVNKQIINFECDWLIEVSDNNLASELVESRSSFRTNHNQGNCNFYCYSYKLFQ